MAIAGGALAALGQGISMWASKKENEKYRALIKDQRKANDRWWNIRKSEDPTMRADTQAYITRQRELLQDANNLTAATARVSGASPEAVALQKEASNKAAAQTISNLAAQGAAEKRTDEQAYRATDAALAQQQAQTHAQQAQQNAAAGAQAVNAGINLIGVEARNMELNRKPATGTTSA